MRQREGHRVKRLPLAMRTLRNGLKPYLALPVGEFSKQDLPRRPRSHHRPRQAVPGKQGGRLSLAGAAWAANEDLIATNFARDLRKSPERARDRVLAHGEIAALWHAAGDGRLRTPGEVSSAHRAATFRGCWPPPWRHPQRRLAATRQQVGPAAFAAALADRSRPRRSRSAARTRVPQPSRRGNRQLLARQGCARCCKQRDRLAASIFGARARAACRISASGPTSSAPC